jgi:hypothetical protein
MYNTSRINEHYGNFVTYMRLNNLVPPSTAARLATWRRSTRSDQTGHGRSLRHARDLKREEGL